MVLALTERGQLAALALQIRRTRNRKGHCDLLPESLIAPMTHTQLAHDAAVAQTVLLIAEGGHVDRALGVLFYIYPKISRRKWL